MVGVPKTILDPKTGAVGIRYLPPTSTRPPLRIFYPAEAPTEAAINSSNNEDQIKQAEGQQSVTWFQDTGVLPYLMGYAHTMVASHNSLMFQWAIQPFLFLLADVLPMGWLRIPGLYQDAKPLKELAKDKSADVSDNTTDTEARTKRYPLIIFSHGLTGTGQENAALCAAWAKRGFVVAAVHHTDGSSCRVQQADGSVLFYDHVTSYDKYDINFRPRQIQQRSNELMQTFNSILKATKTNAANNNDDDVDDSFPLDLAQVINPACAIAAGYSYGAATVARTVVRNDSPFQAALLLDGWFHIALDSKTAKDGTITRPAIDFPFPQEAFDLESVKNGDGLPIPSLFLNSQQFDDITCIANSTNRLVGQKNERVVIPQTGHQNFCDVIFWFRPMLLRAVIADLVGKANPVSAYQEILERSTSFMLQQVQQTSLSQSKRNQ